MGSPVKYEGVRILLVDDDSMVLEVVRDILQPVGFEIVETKTGEGAIKFLTEQHFELIIADKNLPGINGLAVLRHAKHRDPKIATLLITAYASRQSAEEAMTIGIDDYVIKPFDRLDLVKKVEDALERRRSRSGVGPRPDRKPDRLKILVCDNNDESRLAILDGMHKLGHTANLVQDLGDVLEALSSEWFDGLICDLALLNSDDTMAAFLRSKLVLTPELHFVAIASGKNLESAISGLHRGARFVLYRPLGSGKEVADMLRDFFGEAALSDGARRVRVAREDIAAGTKIHIELFDTLDIPMELAISNVVTWKEVDKLIGKKLDVPRVKGDLILWNCFR